MSGSKNCYIYTMEFYAAERKKELLPFVTAWTELENILLSEISQAVKDKHSMVSPIRGTYEQKQTNGHNRTRDMETWNRLTVTTGEGRRVVMERRGRD